MFMKNNHATFAAFTLIEGLLSLLVVSLLVFFMQLLVVATAKVSTYNYQKCALEWHLFLSQLENNSKDWELQTLDSQKMVFINRQEIADEPQKAVTFELSRYKNQLKIKKRGGYEPLLTKVVSSHFSLENQEVRISVVMEDGKNYEGSFYRWRTE